MEKFFKLKENGTTVSTEIMAGITTFFAMAYIIAVNPSLLSSAGMEWGAVFLGHRYADHGTCRQCTLCAGTGHGTECILCLYRVLCSGVYLAAGAVHGIYLWFDQYFHHSDKDP